MSKTLWQNYSPGFWHYEPTNKSFIEASHVSLLIEQTVPRYIMLAIKDLVCRLDFKMTQDSAEKQPNDRFIKLHFSNKGMAIFT